MRPGKGRASVTETTVDLTDKLVRWSAVGLKYFTAALVIGTAYLLWGVYGGHLVGTGVDARTLGNLRLMGQIMAVGGGLGSICFVIVTYEEVAYAVVAGMLGVAYLFGAPLLIAGQLGGADQAAVDTVMRWTALTGWFIVAVVGIRVLMEIALYLREGPRLRAALMPEAKAEAKTKTSARPWYRLSRCWELPYCHGAIRELCPAYKQQKNCWKLQLGCNCDPHMIESLIRAGGAQHGKADITSGQKMVHEAYVRSDLTADRRLGKAERTRECKTCPIYLEHQREKFKVLNPVVIVGTIVGLFAAYPLTQELYKAVLAGMSSIASSLSYGSRIDPGVWFKHLDTPPVRFFFFIILFLLVLSYMLKFVEWAILVRKL